MGICIRTHAHGKVEIAWDAWDAAVGRSVEHRMEWIRFCLVATMCDADVVFEMVGQSTLGWVGRGWTGVGDEVYVLRV